MSPIKTGLKADLYAILDDLDDGCRTWAYVAQSIQVLMEGYRPSNEGEPVQIRRFIEITPVFGVAHPDKRIAKYDFPTMETAISYLKKTRKGKALLIDDDIEIARRFLRKAEDRMYQSKVEDGQLYSPGAYPKLGYRPGTYPNLEEALRMVKEAVLLLQSGKRRAKVRELIKEALSRAEHLEESIRELRGD